MFGGQLETGPAVVDGVELQLLAIDVASTDEQLQQCGTKSRLFGCTVWQNTVVHDAWHIQ